MSSSRTAPAGAPCWICREEGPDDNGEPLMRGCSCRGDSAGFAHVACVAGYARRKSDEAYDKAETTGDYDASNNPWIYCPNCKQKYSGEMALAIANARFEIIQAAEIPETDYRYIYTSAIMLADARFDLGDLQGAKELQERGLELLRANPTLPYLASLRLDLLTSLVSTLTELSNDLSLDCLYEMRDIASGHIAIGHAAYAQHLQRACLQWKQKLEGRGDAIIPASLFRSQFEAMRREHGKDGVNTLIAMLNLASALAEEGKISEALDIIEEGLKDAKRVLGPDHQTTRLFEKKLHEIESLPRTLTGQDATLIADEQKGGMSPGGKAILSIAIIAAFAAGAFFVYKKKFQNVKDVCPPEPNLKRDFHNEDII